MLKPLDQESVALIADPKARAYAQSYLDRAANFMDQVAELGLPFAERCRAEVACREAIARTCAACVDVVSENDDRSVHRGEISPSCLACRKGMRTVTFLISTRCPRNCWFCFNDNQANFEELKDRLNDVCAEIDDHKAHGAVYDDIALTGGEPLLHKPQVEAFFRHAKELYPNAYTRLYTSGWNLDEAFLEVLRDVRLDEIRFSVKTEDSPQELQATYDRIALAKAYIPRVMVEMPVMPDGLDQMKGLLVKLDELGVWGINLLELCYPLVRPQEYLKRGYAIKNPPYRVLDNYWYAGGLPIDGSEDACLALLEFASQQGLGMRVHYCSLENKFTSQVYTLNRPYPKDGLRQMSPVDHYLRSAKVVGADAARTDAILRREGVAHEWDRRGQEVEMPLSAIPLVAAELPGACVFVCSYVASWEERKPYLREVAVQLVG